MSKVSEEEREEAKREARELLEGGYRRATEAGGYEEIPRELVQRLARSVGLKESEVPEIEVQEGIKGAHTERTSSGGLKIIIPRRQPKGEIPRTLQHELAHVKLGHIGHGGKLTVGKYAKDELEAKKLQRKGRLTSDDLSSVAVTLAVEEGVPRRDATQVVMEEGRKLGAKEVSITRARKWLSAHWRRLRELKSLLREVEAKEAEKPQTPRKPKATKSPKRDTGHFAVDPREVRQIATRMGIPPGTELPPVYVEKELPVEDQVAQLTRLKKRYRREYPAGYAIFILEKTLAKLTRDEYILGQEARDDIRHELRHYMRRRRSPKLPLSEKMPWKELLAFELDAELKGRTKRAPSESIASTVRGVAEERKVPETEVMSEARRVGRRMGVSEQALDRTEGILGGHPVKTKSKSLTEAVEQTPEGRKAPLAWEAVPVVGHERRTPSGGRTWVRKHKRLALKRQG